MKREPILPSRNETVRQAIQKELEIGPTTAQELSKFVSIREKEVPAHLEHLAKSVKQEGKKLRIEPPTCLLCGFIFSERLRFTKPSKCPECRGTRIAPPSFSIR